MAKTIALYRLPDLPAALEGVDALIVEDPDDPYFHELKGQMLFENGRIEEAIAPYRKAVALRPTPLLRVGLAQALIESGAPQVVPRSIAHLEEAVAREPTNASAWRLLGIAQGRDGLEGVSNLSLAEYALLIGGRTMLGSARRAGPDGSEQSGLAQAAGRAARDRRKLTGAAVRAGPTRAH